MNVTEPNALLELLDLQARFGERVGLYVFETHNSSSYHPKAYLFREQDGQEVAWVGSSNLTKTALQNGLEWNYRVVTSRDREGMTAVRRAFEDLLNHPQVRPLTGDWVDAYRATRGEAFEPAPETGVVPEAEAPPPEPHVIQKRALQALVATRSEGNSAGLVVLATGLGKTWLSAFDSKRPEFRRILFVAHREEILGQAMATFRRIRPEAHLGMYSGKEKTPEADILFASIQTIGRRVHLEKFDVREFDYIVVDEFHHAAARSYRGLIDYFEPKFLLGLTATPERTDGGDLLALCQENLIFRCDLAEGIREGLLSPFHYFGVPDEVDYSNIPWRSSRFDEAALTAAVATQKRAQNALDQYHERAGARTLAFCCSVRHADFMRDYFRQASLRVASVHSGKTSDPRTLSLEQLVAGELDVIFAVDMFNEGVDLPNVDTVMMLRPTESRILWLQQLGRGLRKSKGKVRLVVIDYIGNHRSFLLKPQSLFGLPIGDAHIARVLEQFERGQLELPPGCEVTYDLQTIEILRGLLRRSTGSDVVRFEIGRAHV
jgi:superfamily II DNA or RNA helicase